MKDVPRVMDRPRAVADRLVAALQNEGLIVVLPSSDITLP
jgi:hypothetical protein